MQTAFHRAAIRTDLETDERLRQAKTDLVGWRSVKLMSPHRLG